jgi:hypothetical protein
VVYLGFMAVGIDIGKPFKAGLGRLDVGGLVEDLKRQIDEIAQTEVCQLRNSECVRAEICRAIEIRSGQRMPPS